ncbi:hypothetical protein [Alicyclobacillus fodiniaquatilis]|uniref:Uncharacterized protein n=1 Tax=Alicyclobacillus fodiniaquatilis TaxID=1661150 RepID=A0ABW4JGT9_9BACL
MNQMSLFAMDCDDLSQVDFWAPREFLQVLDGNVDRFKEVMIARGIQEPIVDRMLYAASSKGLKLAEKFINIALTWKDKQVKPFVNRNSEDAFNQNAQNELIVALSRTKSDGFGNESEFIRSILTEKLEQWVGQRLWNMNRFTGHDKIVDWLKEVHHSIALLDELKQLGAEEISADEIKKGDIIVVRGWNGRYYRGVLLYGTIMKYKNGSPSYAEVKIWLNQDDESIQKYQVGFQEKHEDDYLEWMKHHPLLWELASRTVIRTGGTQFYRLGHMADWETHLCDDNEVRHAIKSLPQPETPEKFWGFWNTSRNDWFHAFHSDARHDFLFYFMSKFDIAHCERVMVNSSCKPGRRGTTYDHLPSDDVIKPLVDALVQADTVEAVEEALRSYFWVEKWTSVRGTEYSISMANKDYSCYDGLYKAGLAQSRDAKFITRVLQFFAMNARNGCADAFKWSPETGLVVQDLEEDLDEWHNRRREEAIAVLSNAKFLGVLDQTANVTDTEDDEELEISDEDMNSEDDEEQELEMNPEMDSSSNEPELGLPINRVDDEDDDYEEFLEPHEMTWLDAG